MTDAGCCGLLGADSGQAAGLPGSSPALSPPHVQLALLLAQRAPCAAEVCHAAQGDRKRGPALASAWAGRRGGAKQAGQLHACSNCLARHHVRLHGRPTQLRTSPRCRSSPQSAGQRCHAGGGACSWPRSTPGRRRRGSSSSSRGRSCGTGRGVGTQPAWGQQQAGAWSAAQAGWQPPVFDCKVAKQMPPRPGGAAMACSRALTSPLHAALQWPACCRRTGCRGRTGPCRRRRSRCRCRSRSSRTHPSPSATAAVFAPSGGVRTSIRAGRRRVGQQGGGQRAPPVGMQANAAGGAHLVTKLRKLRGMRHVGRSLLRIPAIEAFFGEVSCSSVISNISSCVAERCIPSGHAPGRRGRGAQALNRRLQAPAAGLRWLRQLS